MSAAQPTRGNAETALRHLREMMGKLKLPVNEEKTRVCSVPDGEFDFFRLVRLTALGRGPSWAKA